MGAVILGQPSVSGPRLENIPSTIALNIRLMWRQDAAAKTRAPTTGSCNSFENSSCSRVPPLERPASMVCDRHGERERDTRARRRAHV